MQQHHFHQIDGVSARTAGAIATSIEASPPRGSRASALSLDSGGGTTRALERADIPRVAELFLTTFRGGHAPPTQELAAAIAATYLDPPAYTPETGSIVHVDARGRVDGFMGVINIDLRLGERTLKAGILSAYMADRPESSPEIGVRLVRAAISRPLDVVFTDTANRTSLDISRALRFSVLPAQSLAWTKVFRPAGAAAYWLFRGRPRLRGWTAPVAAALDRVLPALAFTAVDRRVLEGVDDRAVAAAAFVAAAPSFLPGDALRPAWDERELSWLVRQAGLRTKYGPLHIREVVDRTGRVIGLYLMYAERGGVAYALQVLSRAGRESQVWGNLLARAEKLGAVAVRGASSLATVEGLIRQPGVVYRNVMSTIVRTSDPEASAAVQCGKVLLGGLAGETWARVFGDDFARPIPKDPTVSVTL